MKTLKILVLSVFLVSIMSVTGFAQLVGATDDKTTCSPITDTSGNVMMSIAKLSGLCKEFFASSQTLTFFVILPAVLFGIIIYGVLEEIGLFASKPGIHVAMAILLSMMMLPTGIFSQLTMSIYTTGAMASVLSVAVVFLLGLTSWMRRKMHTFGYAGVFSGWIGWLITASALGLIGYIIGRPIGQPGYGIAIGAGVGFLWSWLGGKGQLMTAGAISHKISTMQNMIRKNAVDIAKQKAMQPGIASNPAALSISQARIMSLEKENQIMENEIIELEKKHQVAMLGST